MFGLCASTADKAEGTTAFLAKRAPRFIGSCPSVPIGDFR